MRNNLTSTEYTQLFALKIERSALDQKDFTDNEYIVVANWLDHRIEILESKRK